ncbi:MAG: hypothetical protein QGI21_03600 [Candidatus Poseidoniaceae archaeon]|nr:hypothetical protein [Candidatus Poseidoniaceae archaeon]
MIPLWKRKTAAEEATNVCPYCEFANQDGISICEQCYYELDKAPRDQGEPLTKEISDTIFDELMSDEDDSWEDAEAVDVVLKLDEDPLEVNQYEVTNFDSEEPEEVDFLDSRTPEMNEVVSYEEQKITAEDIGKAPNKVDKIDFSGFDPLSEVDEPVHQGKGNLFSPSSPKMDDDLTGHIGGSELPSLPPDNLYENRIDLTANKAPAPTPAVVLPNLPKIEETVKEVPEEIVVEEKPPPEIIQESEEITATPKTNDDWIWPWFYTDPWDSRQVHREVVSALEQVKSGKLEEASTTIDLLGPHLTNENVDMIYHIGMILKQIGRSEDAKEMILRADRLMPENDHVKSAKTHLEL